MRSLLFALGIVVGTAALGGSAHAQNYPWCAEYGGGDMGGGTNCGFTTFEQCMATLSGMGGFCNRNTQYVPPPGPHTAASPAFRRHPRHYPQY
jgi:Protein of unknown function (DUF3551)